MMWNTLFSTWPSRVVRIALGLAFLAAGGIKLSNPRAFAQVLSQWNLVPDVLLVPVALGLPALEFLAGLGLVFNVRGSLEAITGLLVMFTLVLYYGILKDLDVDCGCYTLDDLRGQASLRHAFLRDLIMLGGAAYLYTGRFVRSRIRADRLGKSGTFRREEERC